MARALSRVTPSSWMSPLAPFGHEEGEGLGDGGALAADQQQVAGSRAERGEVGGVEADDAAIGVARLRLADAQRAGGSAGTPLVG